jgi:hypothetical protein
MPVAECPAGLPSGSPGSGDVKGKGNLVGLTVPYPHWFCNICYKQIRQEFHKMT